MNKAAITQQTLDSGETFKVTLDYLVSKDGVFNAQDERLSDTVFISRVLRDTTGLLQLEITFEFEGHWLVQKIEPSEIQPTHITGLLGYGVGLDTKYAKELARYLALQRKLCRSIKSYDYLGWSTFEGRPIFFDHELKVTDDESEVPVLIGRYGGNLDVCPSGNYNAWLAGVKNQVLGHSELELILVVALTSVLVGYDQRFLNQDIGNAIVHLFGDSSSGKTTAEIMALSVYGNPDPIGKRTLLKTFASTTNSMVKSLVGLHGYLLAFDDIGASNVDDLTDFLYVVANGKEKDRLTSNAQMSDGGTVASWVLTTGEESIADRLKLAGGVAVRFIELENLQYTKSAAHAEEIKKIFLNNYGFAAAKLAELIQDTADAKLIELLTEKQKGWVDEYSGDAKSGRFMKKLAAIEVTADLAEKVFDINLNKEGIHALLQTTLKQQLQRLNADAYNLNVYINWVVRNQDYFRINGCSAVAKGKQYGSINCSDNEMYEVMIPEITFIDICKNLGLPSAKVLLKAWKKSGVTKTEHGRLYWRDASKNKFVVIRAALNLNSTENEGSKTDETTTKDIND